MSCQHRSFLQIVIYGDLRTPPAGGNIYCNIGAMRRERDTMIHRYKSFYSWLRKYEIIGVVSYGFGCGSEYEGKINQRRTSFIKWLQADPCQQYSAGLAL